MVKRIKCRVVRSVRQAGGPERSYRPTDPVKPGSGINAAMAAANDFCTEESPESGPGPRYGSRKGHSRIPCGLVVDAMA